MKPLSVSFAAILSIMILCGQDLSGQTMTYHGQLVVPDVMNHVNLIEQKGDRLEHKAVQLDTFPLFPGFPQHISGSSIEGGIVCNMDADTDLEIVYNIGYTVQAWNIDGSNVPGWPKTVSPYPPEGAPAFGDIDGDGAGEIVVTTRGATSGGTLYAFERNGANVTGFPVNHGYSTRTPVLADLNGDGALEIIINKRLSNAGEVWVYRGNGTVYPGWPKPIGHVPASSAAVGDITGDGVPEIVGQSYNALYVWKTNGDSLPGFPFFMPFSAVNSYSSAVLADLDRDGVRDIVFGTHVLGGGGYVFALKSNGTQLAGWPQSTGNWIYGPPAVGYVDGDSLLDVLVGDQVLSPTPIDYVYGWNSAGVALSGFPIGPLNAINNQVAIGNLDSDPTPEIMFDDNTSLGIYLAYNHNGTPLAGWPIYATGTTFFNMPCLTDVNRDGILDIVGAAREGTTTTFTNVYLWNTGIAYSAARTTIPMWQYNTAHDGMYGRPSVVRVEEEEPNVVSGFRLEQNYPNPFNPVSNFQFTIPRSQFTILTVYDVLGREVATLMNEVKHPGTYTVQWDGSRVASGVYFYRLQAGGFVDVKKSILIK